MDERLQLEDCRLSSRYHSGPVGAVWQRPGIRLGADEADERQEVVKLRRIEICFPVSVEITAEEQRQLHEILGKICLRYEADHPDRVMWIFGIGHKPHFNRRDCGLLGLPFDPEGPSEGEPTFDDDVLQFSISEREKT